MATARDTLLNELVGLLKSSYTEHSQKNLLALLDRFRIQAKSNLDSKNGTARELLVNQLFAIWKKLPAPDYNDAVGHIIGNYRMQLKPNSTLERQNTKAPKNGLFQTAKTVFNKLKSEPLAGGPQKRHRIRGECPKCHSMGVVVARSYSGDEYLSCIYCGYQGHRASMELEFDLPMAAELLSRRFDGKDSH